MSSLEAYLRDSFYKDYRLNDQVPLEPHLCFHLSGNVNFTQEERVMLKDLLGLTPHRPFPLFVSVALMIDLVMVMMD